MTGNMVLSQQSGSNNNQFIDPAKKSSASLFVQYEPVGNIGKTNIQGFRQATFIH